MQVAHAFVVAATQAPQRQQQPQNASPMLHNHPVESKKKKLLRPRTIKRCTAPACESFARSRGFCKAHGGGKRCKQPDCMLSDQGGGFCIRHGGGKRCEVEGCLKSAQSRRFCKAHGGGDAIRQVKEADAAARMEEARGTRKRAVPIHLMVQGQA
uniref:WRKY19-like zinc finger domain-containing protein n=1 Tax=Globisporangium ultimum (strain ATCC 200006 / CBS 805.95 / DAOM BR144) TaxID=431595 RepID=K3WYA9_GLOUD